MVRVLRSASAWLDRALALIAPPECACCGELVSWRDALCGACSRGVIPSRTRVATLDVYAAGGYDGPLSAAVKRLKYAGRADLARPLGALVAHAVEGAEAADVVVPVPLHPRRLAERGFNQSALLGRVVAARLGIAFAPLALRRERETPAQASLDAAQRAANVRGSFGPRRPDQLRGASVVLVDDVVTTGATAAACADAVIAAGGRTVCVAALALRPRYC